MLSSFSVGLPELLVVVAIAASLALTIWPFWRIFSKAGFSGWLSLLTLIPLVNIAVLLYLAFAEWPVHRELNLLKQKSGR